MVDVNLEVDVTSAEPEPVTLNFLFRCQEAQLKTDHAIKQLVSGTSKTMFAGVGD